MSKTSALVVGVPTEIKPQEARVGLTPASVHELHVHGIKVLVQSKAGIGIGASDADYHKAGATIVKTAEEIFRRADLIVKVKEPLGNEAKMLRENQILFSYLHLAVDAKSVKDLQRSKSTCIAYELVSSPSGAFPLLIPMSRIAGRLATQSAALCLLKQMGGSGKLLSGGGGVEPAKVVILGGGVVGLNAAKIASGMGARVYVFDKSLEVIDKIENQFPNLIPVYSSKAAIAEHVVDADVVIGAVLIPGMAAPKLINKKTLSTMPKGSVVVDVAIDQGGCLATSRPTTHAKPVFIEEGVVHYCVANMPGSVPYTATHALNNATLPYVLNLAKLGHKALVTDKYLRAGLSVIADKLTCSATGKSLHLPYISQDKALDLLT